MSQFKCLALEELANQQMRFAPPQRKLEQLKRAEKLMTEIDAIRDYPYQFLCFRITDYRPEGHADLVIPGYEARHDLGLIISRLANSIPAQPIESLPEPVKIQVT